MSNKDLVSELKAHIKELTSEKDALNLVIAQKDGRIKQLLLKIEDANDEVKSIAKRMDECKADAEEAREETDKVKKRIKQIKNSLGGGLAEEPDAEKQEATQD